MESQHPEITLESLTGKFEQAYKESTNRQVDCNKSIAQSYPSSYPKYRESELLNALPLFSKTFNKAVEDIGLELIVGQLKGTNLEHNAVVKYSTLDDYHLSLNGLKGILSVYQTINIDVKMPLKEVFGLIIDTYSNIRTTMPHLTFEGTELILPSPTPEHPIRAYGSLGEMTY